MPWVARYRFVSFTQNVNSASRLLDGAAGLLDVGADGLLGKLPSEDLQAAVKVAAKATTQRVRTYVMSITTITFSTGRLNTRREGRS